MNPGDSLGPYRLVRQVGHGGMGVVWEAEGPTGQVAVKIIPDFLAGDDMLIQRLRREAETVKKLSHPALRRLGDIGVAGGRTYMVMDFLGGQTLGARLAQTGRLPIEEVERLAVQLSDVLSYIHSRGVVHRDLKPDNLFLTSDGNLKLIDLGVAKVLDDASLTVTGSHFGTPAYMSPESFRDSKTVTVAADIWSYGVILYEAACGHRPFGGSTAASIIAKISDHNYKPQAPSLLRPDLPAELAGIIGDCIRNHPVSRLSASAVFSRLTGRTPPHVRAIRRRRWIAAGTVLVAVAVLAGVWGTVPQKNKAEDVPSPSGPVASFYPVGNDPITVRSADFNADGHLDMVVANEGNDISILFGIGDGQFEAQRRFPTRSSSGSLTLVNFDRDDILDVLSTSSDSKHLILLHGRSGAGGAFDPVVTLDLPGGPRMAGIEDMDGDGRLDLWVIRSDAGDVVVFPDAAGWPVALGDSFTFPVGLAPEEAVFVDLDGDGRKDLATANYNSNNVGVLFGAVSGWFQPARQFAVGKSPNSITYGDFNRDGRMDLAVVNYQSNDVSVLLSRGNRDFEPDRRFSVGGLGAHSIASAGKDLDEDGNPDLAVANMRSGDVTVMFGDGRGNFGRRLRMGGMSGTRGIWIDDVNADGHADLISVNKGTDDAAIMLGIGDGTFRPPTMGWDAPPADSQIVVAVRHAGFPPEAMADLARVLLQAMRAVKGQQGWRGTDYDWPGGFGERRSMTTVATPPADTTLDASVEAAVEAARRTNPSATIEWKVFYGAGVVPRMPNPVRNGSQP